MGFYSNISDSSFAVDFDSDSLFILKSEKSKAKKGKNPFLKHKW